MLQQVNAVVRFHACTAIDKPVRRALEPARSPRPCHDPCYCRRGGRGLVEARDRCVSRCVRRRKVCVFITAVPNRKLFARGEGDSGGHVLRETTSRGLYGLVCPTRTSERGFGGCLQRAAFVCVCLLLQSLLQSCSRGVGGGGWRTCATRD